MSTATAPRWVLDTNVVIAGLLWSGPPRRLLEHASDKHVVLVSSAVLLDELAHTLSYSKFTRRIAQVNASTTVLIARYAAMTSIVRPTATPRVVPRDPDDDHVIACAIAAQADAIVSGDRDLLDLGEYHGIPIIPAVDALARIA